VSDLDGLRLSVIAALAVAVSWLFYRAQVRALEVPRRPVLQLGACLGGGFLAVLGLYHGPGTVGAVLAWAALLGALRFVTATATSRLPSTTPAVDVGEAAPDFLLPGEDGIEVRLSSLRGRPVLLKFVRGRRCAHCIAELERWEAFRTQFETFGVTVLVVSPDRISEVAAMKRRHRLGMRILSDGSFEVTTLYNLRQERILALTGLPLRPLTIPATFLLDDEGIVRWIDQAQDYRLRSDVDRVMAAIKRTLPKSPEPPSSSRPPAPEEASTEGVEAGSS
jgi:peroxiredoxin